MANLLFNFRNTFLSSNLIWSNRKKTGENRHKQSAHSPHTNARFLELLMLLKRVLQKKNIILLKRFVETVNGCDEISEESEIKRILLKSVERNWKCVDFLVFYWVEFWNNAGRICFDQSPQLRVKKIWC